MNGKCVILLPGEALEKLQAIASAAKAIYNPQNAYEEMLLDLHISAAWRARRQAGYETALVSIQMQIDAPELEKQFKTIDPTTRQALASRTLEKTQQQLHRAEAELTRISKRWQQTLEQVQQLRKANEGSSENKPTAATTPSMQSTSEPKPQSAPPPPAPFPPQPPGGLRS